MPTLRLPLSGLRFRGCILRAYPRTGGDWLILRRPVSKMCLSPFSSAGSRIGSWCGPVPSVPATFALVELAL